MRASGCSLIQHVGQPRRNSAQVLFATLIALGCAVGVPHPAWSQAGAPGSAQPGAQAEISAWMRRGMPGLGHAALEPLIGTWRVEMGIYATFGRSGDEPPIVSTDLICRREWVADGRYVEDLTEGTAAGRRYWRKGWLGYSNMDHRYEWVTIDAVNSTMMRYAGALGTGAERPISMSGTFTDQGVAGEAAVGREVPMRTVIRIENADRHVFELYFAPPGRPEVLATRAVYTRQNR
jgi:Protein of unknown function (DUF1579)